MAAAVTYQGDIQRSASAPNSLFAGTKFWFSQAVPQRKWLIQNAELNGAQIVQLEQQADIKLVDHARKNQAPGTHSYRYVELSIRNGQLEDLEAHRVGSIARVNRPVGSIVTAPKGGRTRFTEAEDQLLWNWIKPFRDAGGPWKGNEIYKQLEQFNPIHTFQSWRDRYIKIVQFQNKQVTEQAHAALGETYDQENDNPRTPKRRRIAESSQIAPQQANTSAVQDRRENGIQDPSHLEETGNVNPSQIEAAQALDMHIQNRNLQHRKIHLKLTDDQAKAKLGDNNDATTIAMAMNESGGEKPAGLNGDETSVAADSNRLPLAYNFTQFEARMLYNATCRIIDAHPDTLDESWAGVAEEWGHTKETWRTFFYELIVPEYKRRHDIHSKEELEAHCRAYQLAVQERKAREKAHALEIKARKIGEPMEGQKQDGKIPATGYDASQTDEPGKNLESGRTDQVVASNPAQNMNSWKPEQAPLSSAIITNRPPQPNESRKLIQGRGSQSTSSQSQPRSQPHSQTFPTSQTSQQNSQHSQPSLPARRRLNLDNHAPSEWELDEDDPSPQRVEKQALNAMNPPTETLPTSQQSGEQYDYSSRFVTQVSQERRTTTTDSNADLEDIPYRAPTPIRPQIRSESPMFVPEESDQHRLQSSKTSNEDEHSDLASSPPVVQLVEDDEIHTGADHVSDYTPSEAPSEGVQFESELGLSQAWETAPEAIHEEVQEEHDDTNPDEPSATKNSETSDNLNDQVNGDLDNDESSDDDFETALAMQRTTQMQGTTNGAKGDDGTTQSFRNKVDTQALFQQPIQDNLAEMLTLPEPSEGWTEDEAAISTNEDMNITNAEPSASNADWTLPLPDPELELDERPPSPSAASDNADIDNWLADQLENYKSVSPLLLQPLSHRALETTSMEIEHADTVLARMVQRYEKGKYPAHLSLADIGKLRKRERKTIIAKIVDALVPEDMSGCWTRLDDVALQGVNGREVKRVEDKHGQERMSVRFEFLEMWNAK